MIHPIDQAAGLLLAHGPARLRVFSGGWGDPGALSHLEHLERLPPPERIEPEWGRPEPGPGATILRHGSFASPVDELPPRARTGHVLEVSPADGARWRCLLMSAWNDHGYASRIELARRLAGRGIGSLILENPYYGKRRPEPDVDQPIRTVADFALMGLGAITEGRGILTGVSDRFQVGVSGFSMGGNLAALVAATMPGPLATAPLAASHSPGPVYLDGVLRHGIAWDSLQGPDDPAGELRRRLTAASALRIPVPEHGATAVIVAARNDGFVPVEAVRALHRHWPGSELRELRGGHATLWYRGKHHLVDAIATAFRRSYAD